MMREGHDQTMGGTPVDRGACVEQALQLEADVGNDRIAQPEPRLRRQVRHVEHALPDATDEPRMQVHIQAVDSIWPRDSLSRTGSVETAVSRTEACPMSTLGTLSHNVMLAAQRHCHHVEIVVNGWQ